MTDRTTLALPIDTVRNFDHTVTQAQIQANTFQATPDDVDMLQSRIKDAEDEYRARTGLTTRLSRAGTPGDRSTYDEITYKVPGHETYKRNWSRVGGDYLNQEVTKDLSNDRVLPFDSSEGDEAYIYRGVSGTNTDQWVDVTDQRGELWDIVDHRNGTVSFHPIELDRAMIAGAAGVGISRSRLDKLRFKITYRYGGLGSDRSNPGTTSLTEEITDAESVPFTVGVGDANRLPTTGGGSVVLLVGGEYLRATVDTDNDELDVVERAVRGTAEEAHGSGDRVQYTPPVARKAVAARAAMGLIQAGRYSKWLPDADDTISKGDMMDELRETWESGIEAVA